MVLMENDTGAFIEMEENEQAPVKKSTPVFRARAVSDPIVLEGDLDSDVESAPKEAIIRQSQMVLTDIVTERDGRTDEELLEARKAELVGLEVTGLMKNHGSRYFIMWHHHKYSGIHISQSRVVECLGSEPKDGTVVVCTIEGLGPGFQVWHKQHPFTKKIRLAKGPAELRRLSWQYKSASEPSSPVQTCSGDDLVKILESGKLNQGLCSSEAGNIEVDLSKLGWKFETLPNGARGFMAERPPMTRVHTVIPGARNRARSTSTGQREQSRSRSGSDSDRWRPQAQPARQGLVRQQPGRARGGSDASRARFGLEPVKDSLTEQFPRRDRSATVGSTNPRFAGMKRMGSITARPRSLTRSSSIGSQREERVLSRNRGMSTGRQQGEVRFGREVYATTTTAGAAAMQARYDRMHGNRSRSNTAVSQSGTGMSLSQNGSEIRRVQSNQSSPEFVKTLRSGCVVTYQGVSHQPKKVPSLAELRLREKECTVVPSKSPAKTGFLSRNVVG